MSKIIIANWKNNPITFKEAQALFNAEAETAAKYSDVKTVICPPDVFLSELSESLLTYQLTNLSACLGAQDVFWQPGGENYGVGYALVGHSDRRYPPVGAGDTDEIVNQKIKIALSAGVTPVLLVGEKERGDNRRAVLEKQLTADLTGLTAEQVSKILIAYEPVWAISTNPGAEPDTPENTFAALKIMLEFLMRNFQPPTPNLQFLYGGSVDSRNIADFLSNPEISGAVIGAASLRQDEFARILEIVSKF